MQIVIGNVLPAEEIETVKATLARAKFVDGKATAGFAARMVKNNRQAEGSDRSLVMIRKLVVWKDSAGNDVGPHADPYACAASAPSMWSVASLAASSGVLPRSRATT